MLLYVLMRLSISIHALREESDLITDNAVITLKISIHALREESDLDTLMQGHKAKISIHALREESDVWRTPQMAIKIFYFNPRSP